VTPLAAQPKTKPILAVNAGSSSIKFALFEVKDTLRRTLRAARLRTNRPNRTNDRSSTVTGLDPTADVAALMDAIEPRLAEGLSGVGHRIVQGGANYAEPRLIDGAMIEALRALSPFDPEHLPRELQLIEALKRRLPGVPQVACFDSAFHHDLPCVSRLLPIPRGFEAKGVRRYGFHGLSCSFLMRELARLEGPEAAGGKVILAHLGNGASITAVHHGKSMDTSMALTPASGLPMGTRAGDLDPGLAPFLARTENMTSAQFNDMINFRSGLLGISETSADMRELLRLEPGDKRAAEAVAIFCYQAKKWIGAFAAALGGVDSLIFAGGIGENSPVVRSRICEDMGFLGIELDPKRNNKNDARLSSESGRVKVFRVRTDEEMVIARAVSALLGLGGRGES
jgi:acetate kinase